jgi:hypothetical protein
MKTRDSLRHYAALVVALGIGSWGFAGEPRANAEPQPTSQLACPEFLRLPPRPVPDRASLTQPLEAGEKRTYAQLDGPGCIRHLWATLRPTENANRQVILRVYFDDAPVPYIEAPVGDFFGMMHGKPFYPIDTPFLSVKGQSGYNCYFPMPFARSARIEFESGPTRQWVYLMVDWHRYPGQTLTEPLRFCARWRREMPAQRYGEDYLMLDADDTNRPNIYFRQSLDGGTNWSDAIQVNIEPNGVATDQWQPAMTVKPDGTQLFIGWYDRRDAPVNHHLLRTYGTFASLPVTGPESFTNQFPISTVAFPPAFSGTNTSPGAYDPAYPPKLENADVCVPGWFDGVYARFMGDYDRAFSDSGYVYYTWGDNRRPFGSTTGVVRHQADVRCVKMPWAK